MNQSQIEAMDETMGAQAVRFANSHRHLLADHCGVIEEPRTAVLIRRIGTRQNLLATCPLTNQRRRELEAQNDDDAQELAILEGMATADGTAAELGRWLLGGVIGGACILALVHFVAVNWGL